MRAKPVFPAPTKTYFECVRFGAFLLSQESKQKIAKKGITAKKRHPFSDEISDMSASGFGGYNKGIRSLFNSSSKVVTYLEMAKGREM